MQHQLETNSAESRPAAAAKTGLGVELLGRELSGERYKITAKLGEGGMGFVYRAYDRNLGTDVVIKVPRRAMLEDPAFAGRFSREVRSLVRLAHPHIVRIIDVGEQDGLPFAVMQFLSGGSLKDKQGTPPKPMTPHELKNWLDPVAKALDFIHAQGFIHRDVKPANILFDSHGNVFLSDFGVARALATGAEGRTKGSLTGTGIVLGTPEYMAPEMIMGEKYDGRADQYSLAVTIHEVLSGQVPFTGPTPAAILVQHTTQLPPELHQVVASIRKELSDAVAKGIAKRAEERYATCSAFANAVISAATHPVASASRVQTIGRKLSYKRISAVAAVSSFAVVTSAISWMLLSDYNISSPPRSGPPPAVSATNGFIKGQQATFSSIEEDRATAAKGIEPAESVTERSKEQFDLFKEYVSTSYSFGCSGLESESTGTERESRFVLSTKGAILFVGPSKGGLNWKVTLTSPAFAPAPQDADVTVTLLGLESSKVPAVEKRNSTNETDYLEITGEIAFPEQESLTAEFLLKTTVSCGSDSKWSDSNTFSIGSVRATKYEPLSVQLLELVKCRDFALSTGVSLPPDDLFRICATGQIGVGGWTAGVEGFFHDRPIFYDYFDPVSKNRRDPYLALLVKVGRDSAWKVPQLRQVEEVARPGGELFLSINANKYDMQAHKQGFHPSGSDRLPEFSGHFNVTIEKATLFLPSRTDPSVKQELLKQLAGRFDDISPTKSSPRSSSIEDSGLDSRAQTEVVKRIDIKLSTAEDAAKTFLSALNGRDTEVLKAVISPTATGQLAQIRKGESDEASLRNLAQKYRLSAAVLGVLSADKSFERTVVFGSSLVKTGRFQIQVAWDGEVWRVIGAGASGK